MDDEKTEEVAAVVEKPVESVPESEEGDKWAEVDARLGILQERVDGLTERINDMITEGAVISDDGTTSVGETEEDLSEVDEMDNEFYERQKRMLS